MEKTAAKGIMLLQPSERTRNTDYRIRRLLEREADGRTEVYQQVEQHIVEMSILNLEKIKSSEEILIW